MKIWLITIGEPVPIENASKDRLYRTGYFSNFLADRGHDVTWWTSTFDHFRKYHLYAHDTDLNLSPNLHIKLLHGTGYKHNISLSRILDHKIIARKFRILAKDMESPNLILSSFPTIELSKEAVSYGKKHHVPVILDIRDMWPDIFIHHIPKLIRPIAKLIALPLLLDARKAMGVAYAITGITESFVAWGTTKGRRKKTKIDRCFPMGYTSEFHNDHDSHSAEKYWDEMGVRRQADTFIACFFGTLGRQFDLRTVVQAARQLQMSDKRILFVICGIGDRYNHYKKMAAGISNIVFSGWINAAQIYVLMQKSSVGLDPMKDRFDFLATINNKAIEYMSAGLPVISSPDKGVLYELLKSNNSGMSYPPDNPDALAHIVLRLCNDPALLRELSKNSRAVFKNMFRAEKVYEDMMNYLEEVVQSFRQSHGF